MNTLDDMLRSPDDVPQDPVVKWLMARINAGDEISVTFQQDSSSLGSSISGLIVLRKENSVEHVPQIYPWDDDLNAAMIELGIKAIDIQKEGERFARVLRSKLHKVERRYGDGYMNAVLIDLIDESDLGKDGEIGKIRRSIHCNTPERRGQSYKECREAIAIEIGGSAKEIRNKLKYNPDELKLVMDRAIAQYLDERFSITSLRRLGWIDANGHTTR